MIDSILFVTPYFIGLGACMILMHMKPSLMKPPPRLCPFATEWQLQNIPGSHVSRLRTCECCDSTRLLMDRKHVGGAEGPAQCPDCQ
jgi:hypothetical protein